LNAVVDAVPAQTGHGQLKVTKSVHNLFQFALNAILPGLKSLQKFKQQIFD
jgi:hypothetical protein